MNALRLRTRRLRRVLLLTGALLFTLPLPLRASESARALPYPEVVPAPRFAVHAHAPASLFNLIDRMAAWRTPAAPLDPLYVGYWRAALELTAQDEAHLERYRTLRRRVRGGIPAGGLVDRLADWQVPFPIQVESVRFEDKLALLFLTASDWDAVAQGARLLLTASDEEELLQIFDHFRRRFAWVERRALYLDAYRARARAWFDTARPEAFFARLAAFFHVPASHVERFQLGLGWLPSSAGGTKAFVVEDAAIIEVRDGVGLRQVLDVAVHELAHRLYERMPQAARRDLEWAFLRAPAAQGDSALAAAAANLWWESIATALGQGVFAELYFPWDHDPTRNWYEDPGYDALAKAIAPIVARYLEGPRALDAAFIHETVAAYRTLREAQAGDAPAPVAKPADLVRRAILLAHGPDATDLLGEAAAQARRATRVRLILTYGPDRAEEARRAIQTFPGLPIFLFTTDEAAAGQREALRLAGLPEDATLGEGMTTKTRPNAGPTVVVRAKDQAGALALWRAYLATP